MWTTNLWNGDLAESHAHARAGYALYDRARHHVQTHVYGGHDPGVCALGSAGITAWFLGAADEAMRLVTRGGDLAAALGHPYSRLITRFDFMLVGWLRREVDVVRDAADEALAICTRLGVPDYLAVAKIFLGWTRAMTGQCEAGVALLEEGLCGCREIGAERNMGSHLLLLADACLAMQRTQQGLRAVEEAGELIERTGESRWSAELLRMRGELSLRNGAAPSVAEPLFTQALEIAHRQGARAFELRAATSLARVRSRRRKEARALLEPIYRRFDEGLGTADLRAARALLDELGAAP
jgi:predicted ATPase